MSYDAPRCPHDTTVTLTDGTVVCILCGRAPASPTPTPPPGRRDAAQPAPTGEPKA
jgi:hypothetical protein